MPSSTVHARFAATATRLIDRHGRSMELRTPRTTGPAYNPTTTYTTQVVVGVVTDYSHREIDGNLIQANDKKILIAGAGVDITTDMRIQDGGIDYPIVSVSTLTPGNTQILHTVQVRL